MLDVDGEDASQVVSNAIEIDVERMHGGDRRSVRVQHTGPEQPFVSISGSVRGQQKAISRVTDAPLLGSMRMRGWIAWSALASFVLFLVMMLGSLMLDINPLGVRRHFWMATEPIPPEHVDEFVRVVGGRAETFHEPRLAETTSSPPLGLILLLPAFLLVYFPVLSAVSDSAARRLGLKDAYAFDRRRPGDF